MPKYRRENSCSSLKILISKAATVFHILYMINWLLAMSSHDFWLKITVEIEKNSVEFCSILEPEINRKLLKLHPTLSFSNIKNAGKN